ncbi:MAG TPA: response regulator [Oligoflexus sp.]|uniref:response regulator n=1 Tax=Oligoflexus sp. TaxID=1971216 RepID=UPI002D56BF06|nr:response regulator [Oligoflexus sp.]HYX38617.1 response regulator [Oligoflexus sp.]
MLNVDSDKRKFTVLAVDDSRDMLVLLKSVLKRKGMTVLTAETPKAAFSLFQKHPEINLIIIDINLRDQENGIALAKKFHDCGARRLFSMCFVSSSRVDESFVEAVHKIGVDDFISKPINLETLQSKIDGLLGCTFQNMDLTKRINCHLNCELQGVNIRPKISMTRITPSGFVIQSSADIEVGILVDIHCRQLQTVVNAQSFVVKVLQSQKSGNAEMPFELCLLLVDSNYQVRLALESLFTRHKLPEGLVRDVGDDRMELAFMPDTGYGRPPFIRGH